LRMIRSAAGFDCACKNSDDVALINKKTEKKSLVRPGEVFIIVWS